MNCLTFPFHCYDPFINQGNKMTFAELIKELNKVHPDLMNEQVRFYDPDELVYHELSHLEFTDNVDIPCLIGESE